MAALGTPLTNETALWVSISTDLAIELSPSTVKSLAIIADPLIDPTIVDPSSAYEIT